MTIKKFLASVCCVLMPIASFAANSPDSIVVTGPNNAQVPMSSVVVTPSGGIQTTIGAALNQTSPLPPTSYAYPLRALARQASVAATNNPHYNAVMASPPTVVIANKWAASVVTPLNQWVAAAFTGSGASATVNFYKATTAGTTNSTGAGPTGTSTSTDGTVVWTFQYTRATAVFSNPSANSYLWGGGSGLANAGGVVNYYGGQPLNNVSSGYAVPNVSTTVQGVLTGGGLGRIHFRTDATYTVAREFYLSAGVSATRIIINNQYVSLTPITVPVAGFNYIVIDFSGASVPRIIRDVQIENGGFFGGVDVALTETVSKPISSYPIVSLVGAGDSFMANAGATVPGDGFFPILCDYLGALNCPDTGIGATGYLNANTAGQPPPVGSGTALSRISDVVNQVNAAGGYAVVIDENIYNDSSFTQAQIGGAVTAYVKSLRAQLPTTPIFEFGLNPGNGGGTSYTIGVNAETTKQAAIAAIGDPLVFFCPLLNRPEGSSITGTGTDTATNGTGNSDFYVNGNSLPHSNTVGHAYMAQSTWLTCIRSALSSAGYQ